MRFTTYISFLLSSLCSRVSAMLISHKQRVGSYPSPALTDKHLELATLCRDVYCNGTESSDTYVKSNDTGAQATVRLKGKQVVVCFRGSDSPQDWKLNLQLYRVPFISRTHKNPANEVHSGFFIGHHSIKAKIYTKLNAFIASGECDSILFTGHSSGGALAAIAAFDFRNDKHLPVEVVTFGSPKLGNASLAVEYSERITRCTRVVNDNDAIALMPLSRGFHHVGNTLHIQDIAPTTNQGVWHALSNFVRLDSVFDHGIESYIRTIEAHIDKQK
ncbi:FirrV-1-F2 precursor [Feldmannia irregularis virus a]|uniref:FirrV-1-F2 n=1 Tax=Feldmannia irregularis virus a TaxID=231992 RepID=Q6XLV5_9PHYC|nr:FirrV-1-F2 precursor [Feldmannia irregularis virus a]AAR26956.1 FirrV-1-F2 precursor [Feldmannia irregularis virus a]